MTQKYIRWQKNNIESGLHTRRVVLLTGPRQCGKTTLIKELASSAMEYRTLDDITLLQSSKSDPHGFVKHYNNGSMIIRGSTRSGTSSSYKKNR